MKKNFFKLGFYALLVAGMIGCSKDVDVEKQQTPISGVTKAGWVPATTFTDFAETEANNSISTANGPVAIGTRITGNVAVQGEPDYFKVSCQANVPISFFMDGSVYYLNGQVYDATGKNVGYIEFNKIFTLVPSYTGYYYIAISGYAGVTYNVKLTATPEFPETEANNTLATADGPLSLGVTAFGTVEIQAQCDWFKINCTKGNIVSLYLNGSAIYVTAAIYDQNGTLIRYIDYDKPALFYPKATATYYIAIGGYAGVSYSLKVDTNPGFLNEKESNNTVSTANGPIYPGTYIAGVADGTSNVWDYVKFEVVESGPISFYLEGSATYVNATIYNSSNQQIAFLLEKQAFVLNSLPAGTYYAKIGGYSGVSYKFYVNAQYSKVNAKYFKMATGLDGGQIVPYYLCSANQFLGTTLHFIYNSEPFGNLYQYEVSGDFWSGHYLVNYYGNIGSTYSNGFPIFRTDIIVGMK